MPREPDYEILRLGRGYTGTWEITLKGEDRVPFTGYTGSETLALVIEDRIGGDLTLSVGSVAAWECKAADGSIVTGAEAAALGKCRFTVDDADSGAMEPGRRWLSVEVVDGGETVEAYRAILLIEPR